MIRNTITTILLFFLFIGCNNSSIEKPNILLIMVDDLNDYNEDLKGHPQVLTPYIKEFSKTEGILFKRGTFLSYHKK